jgi:hypothetical protein
MQRALCDRLRKIWGIKPLDTCKNKIATNSNHGLGITVH